MASWVDLKAVLMVFQKARPMAHPTEFQWAQWLEWTWDKPWDMQWDRRLEQQSAMKKAPRWAQTLGNQSGLELGIQSERTMDTQ
jgi:hypothetical protein